MQPHKHKSVAMNLSCVGVCIGVQPCNLRMCWLGALAAASSYIEGSGDDGIVAPEGRENSRAERKLRHKSESERSALQGLVARAVAVKMPLLLQCRGLAATPRSGVDTMRGRKPTVSTRYPLYDNRVAVEQSLSSPVVVRPINRS